jgi:predicted metalloprotease
MELQADCFAGAFLKHASEAGILTGGDINLGAIREAIRTVGDDVTTDYVPGSEHGTGAERLAHFDTGWNATAQACV